MEDEHINRLKKLKMRKGVICPNKMVNKITEAGVITRKEAFIRFAQNAKLGYDFENDHIIFLPPILIIFIPYT